MLISIFWNNAKGVGTLIEGLTLYNREKYNKSLLHIQAHRFP